PDGEFGAPGGESRQLEERAVRVQQELDPLAGQQPAPVTVPPLVAFAAAGDGQLDLLSQLVQHGELCGPVGAVSLAVQVDMRGEDRHPRQPSSQCLACSERTTFFWILPVEVLGSSSTTMTALGTLKPSMRAFSAAISPAGSIVSPGLGTTNAVIASLHRSCGRPTTTVSATRGSAA